MLKLKKVQILGFKSFCDRVDIQLAGEGIAVIVGPNGCGKSNISDAITWVLGEQSAKSLRGIRMEDVIFAGTRDRRPTGMAEVSLTLVDPEIFDGTDHLQDGPELVLSDQTASDWDENAIRRQQAEETEATVAESQPGVIYETEAAGTKAGLDAASAATAGTPAEAADPANNPDQVVLKIRRRKFARTPVRAGEITVTRRLFRSGDSEYLLNGKICRLRDIQDIFMGTGLGGESYAMIGQERIGQLLSSKPLDRRGILEEAAGITRFKNKKRLAELRLQSAKENLSRVNDIFEEVTRQVTTLKRQAAKAERYGALRDELRTKLRIVLASRMRELDTEQTAVHDRLAGLTDAIDRQSAAIEDLDGHHRAGLGQGYELDAELRKANATANHAAVELERIAARTSANADRIDDLATRLMSGAADQAQARSQLDQLDRELAEHRVFLEGATAESGIARQTAAEQQQKVHEAGRTVSAVEQQAEQYRRNALAAMQRANATRNEIAQAEAALAGLEHEADRLRKESDIARQELDALGLQRGQARISFESVTERLQRLEAEIGELRLDVEARRSEEAQSKHRGDQLRGEVATLLGRRASLEALIHEHSYSTDTVRNLFKANAQRARESQAGMAPVGTLADFLEVEAKYEQVVDEFLRDELNYIVVKSWDAADAGINLLQSDVAGRATFLVHPSEAQANFPFTEGMASQTAASRDAVPLTDCVRVLNGFGRSLEVILPKLREGFVATDSAAARSLALANPQAFYLSPTGETFHNVTVTAGRVRAQGPLSLKRELAEVQRKLGGVEAELAQTDLATASLAKCIAELNAEFESKGQQRREGEREAANSGAALRQMESEAARIERRLQDWQLATERNRDQRSSRQEFIQGRQHEAGDLEAQHAALDATFHQLQAQLVELRHTREALREAAAAAAAALASLEERRRNAQANFDQTHRLLTGQQHRIEQIEGQLASAASEKHRREQESAELVGQHSALTETRGTAVAEVARFSEEAAILRSRVAELDTRLRALRTTTEQLRDQRAALSARSAKLSSDIEHIEAACLNELGVPSSELRQDQGIDRIAGHPLAEQEEQARALRSRMDAMGPVNMMALEEYTEAATRHGFLETQRQDLLDSIHNTQASIKEIDDVSRIKFDEAFRIINENFSVAFAKLFGGGQAMMRLTDEENAAESGIDIIASPPGKKLQNILLLSGGEKALTALSLLVGIFQFQPAPFCVLDEVDAPLDETNVGRFARLIHDMSATTQFVVITHSKRTMAEADVIYGVTMQEPGVSKVVSVNLTGRRDQVTRRDASSRLAVA